MPEGFAYGGNTLLSHPLVVETILPFLLVFTLVFAVLQKSKVLGEGKRQIDAIVSLVIGLLVISFGQATGIIIQLIPFLAVSLVVVLVFMLLVGSFHDGGDFLPKGFKTFLMIIALIATVIAVMYITNAWDFLLNLLAYDGTGSPFLGNIIFVLLIIGVVAFVMWGARPGSSSGSSKS
jgi:hypothetical protein